MDTGAARQLEQDCPTCPVTITILHTNDTHSWLQPVPGSMGEPDQGGVARRKAVIDAVREERGAQNVLLLDGGDFEVGTIFYFAWGGVSDVKVMNALGYDAVTLGNHEFDRGPAHLAGVLTGTLTPACGGGAKSERLRAPVVVSNIDVSAEPALAGLVLPSAIVTRGTQRFGVVGAITTTTDNISSPGRRIRFLDYVPSVQREVDKLTAQGVNKIILLSHSGSKVDLANAPLWSGVDVIIAGHDHVLFGDREQVGRVEGLGHTAEGITNPYPTVVLGRDGHPTLIVEALSFGRWLGRLDVSFDGEGVIRLGASSGHPIVMRGCSPPGAPGGAPDCRAAMPEDRAMAKLVGEMLGCVDDLRGRVVGEAAVRFSEPGGGHTPFAETALGDLVADVVLAAGAADAGGPAVASVINSGGLRTDIAPGVVTFENLYNVLPFDNRVEVIDLSGAELFALLDGAFATSNPARLRGALIDSAFPQVAGMEVTYRALPADAAGGVPASGYVQSIWIGERRVDPKDPRGRYPIATNDFVAGGGDNYRVLKQVCAGAGGRCRNTGVGVLDALIDHFKSHSPVSAPAAGRVRLVP